MKRLEIYYLFPEVALYEVTKNRFKVDEKKIKFVTKILNIKKNKDLAP